MESNDSALENQRTNNYIISEEGPEGYKSLAGLHPHTQEVIAVKNF